MRTRTYTKIFLRFSTGKLGQTVHILIRLLLNELSDQWSSLFSFHLYLLVAYAVVQPICSDFRLITTIF